MKYRAVLLLSLFLALFLLPFAHAEGNPGGPETIGILLDSRAHRQFTDEPITQEDLDAIIACGLQSPSAVNAQPWHFTVVRNQDVANEIIDTKGVIIVISVTTGGRLGDVVTAFDCGLATQAMYTAAHALGLGANIYWMPVAHVNEAMHEILAIPQGYQALMVLTIGHVDADAISSASSRNNVNEMVTYID